MMPPARARMTTAAVQAAVIATPAMRQWQLNGVQKMQSSRGQMVCGDLFRDDPGMEL